MSQHKPRIAKVTLIQPGPLTEDIERNIEELLRALDTVGEQEHPDYVLCGELSYLPYIGAVLDRRYFDWAESIPGPTTQLFAEKARRYEMCILLGVFEKAPAPDVYHNSTVVLGPDGRIVEGTFPNGERTLRYIKSHIPYNVSERAKYFGEDTHLPPNWGISISAPDGYRYDETFYFAPGDGWPIFNTPKAKIGVTTCFDRHFPEPYRVLALQGAEIIFTPSVAMSFSADRGASMAETYLIELQVRALENSVWLATVNKAGTEVLQGQPTYCYGNSAVIHPTGRVMALASTSEAETITYELDLEDVSMTRRLLPLFQSRRPELYGLIVRNGS